MEFINKYLRNLKPYKLASHKIWAVEPKDREGILKLDWNEATVPPSPKVTARVKELLDGPGFFNLYPTTKNDRLLEAIAGFVKLPIENIQYFGSSDVLHEYICRSFLCGGDKVLMLGPSYDNFRLTCQSGGAEVSFFYYNDDFTFDAAGFETTLASLKPVMTYICNPNNPTGNYHTLEYIRHLLETFPQTLFLIDEAYGEFAGESSKDLVLKYDNIIVTRTLSKAFAMANFRIGYLLASEANIAAIGKIRNPKNITTISQEAAVAALEDADYMWSYVDQVHKGQAYFIEASAQFADHYTVYPSRGNFNLLKFNTREEKMALLGYLADHDIFVRDTTQAPSVEKCFRVTMGTKKQMERVIGVIGDFYKNQK
ncbi:MAG: histidinol-phosphate aminotransferase family protein [Bacteroidales bacterium]|nr:histidinol-phosphate aminotransferase family protein [Bacteroidales bacterium]